MTADDLRAFAASIADEFNRGTIRHPVHLSDGQEDALIRIFETIGPDDWCIGNWRFQSQCLLKGVPEDKLRAAIRSGGSISLCFPEHRVLCSAIVGGSLPIAVGIAMGIKRAGGTERVHCWLGDMTAEGGMAHECMQYSRRHCLPVMWYIEDNQKSVCSPTEEVWGDVSPWSYCDDVTYYRFQSRYPHSGAGVRVTF